MHDDPQPRRRTQISPGLWMLDYSFGVVHVEDSDGHLLAEATRVYRNQGASSSGWFVRIGQDAIGPIRTKPEAVARLKEWVIEEFAARYEGKH